MVAPVFGLSLLFLLLFLLFLLLTAKWTIGNCETYLSQAANMSVHVAEQDCRQSLLFTAYRHLETHFLGGATLGHPCKYHYSPIKSVIRVTEVL